MEIIKKTEKISQLPNELDIELSLIDSGMVITEINGEIIIVLKDSESMISALKNTVSAKIDFTYIDRPEFPSVNLDLRLNTEKDLSIKYSYFFNTEAEYELNLLANILNQKEVYLCLFSDILIISVIVMLEDREKELLSGILDKLNI